MQQISHVLPPQHGHGSFHSTLSRFRSLLRSTFALLFPRLARATHARTGQSRAGEQLYAVRQHRRRVAPKAMEGLRTRPSLAAGGRDGRAKTSSNHKTGCFILTHNKPCWGHRGLALGNHLPCGWRPRWLRRCAVPERKCKAGDLLGEGRGSCILTLRTLQNAPPKHADRPGGWAYLPICFGLQNAPPKHAEKLVKMGLLFCMLRVTSRPWRAAI